MFPDRRIDRRLIETVLGAEIMAHYRSYQVLGTLGAPLGDADDPVVKRIKESMQQEAERVFRLKILYPGHDMHSAGVGLHSDDPVVQDNAIEFLEAVLDATITRSDRAAVRSRGIRATARASRQWLARRVAGRS